ncbi:hypothetical protein VE01_02401 [Pseudogymnoascus verrucosus]|uniref:Uncharacterized protein n=1 Tax=Pseudogymnoascus verrucosus TaxID=342668 RepID=A0A1B8GSU5_9PEZI|nr:uncharacterized protein VE01_02401 [Pseudogymnoascus verrucosus]OBT98909.1 hypothetical protein VE01_02401 [Pseudogymnoascus verrucosus]
MSSEAQEIGRDPDACRWKTSSSSLRTRPLSPLLSPPHRDILTTSLSHCDIVVAVGDFHYFRLIFPQITKGRGDQEVLQIVPEDVAQDLDLIEEFDRISYGLRGSGV